MRWAVLGLVLLLVPVASAAPVEGEFKGSTEVVLPEGALLSSRPESVFVSEFVEGSALRGGASAVRVRVFEDTYASAQLPVGTPVVATGTRRPEWALHEVTLLVEPSEWGWVGLHAQGGGLTERAKGEVSIRLAEDVVLGNAPDSPDDTPAHPYFSRAVPGESLGRSSASWSYEGAGLLKVFGPTLVLVSRENTTRIETGEVYESSNPAQRVRRHVVIEAADLRLDVEAPSQVVSRALRATWDGEATFGEAEGSLRGQLREWRAAGGQERIDGSFEAALTTMEGPGGIVTTLSGDLRDSSMASRVAAPTSAWPMFPILLVMVVAVAVGGMATMMARRPGKEVGPPQEALDAEELAALAYRAADAEDYARAAELIAQARPLAPSNVRLAIDHAYYAWKSGDTQTAARLLASDHVRNDPDALLLLARMQLEEGRPDEATESMARALERQPVLLLDIQDDPHLKVLLGRPEARGAVNRAKRRLG